MGAQAIWPKNLVRAMHIGFPCRGRSVALRRLFQPCTVSRRLCGTGSSLQFGLISSGWSTLQRQLARSATADHERRRIAVEAWCLAAGSEDRELGLGVSDFVQLLEEVVRCPSFSVELHQGPLQRYLYCAHDEFNDQDTPRERSQFFRNQLLRLYFEKALLVRKAFQSFDAVDKDVLWEGVLHSADEKCERKTGGSGMPGNILLAGDQARGLAGFGRDDIFIVRVLGSVEAEQEHEVNAGDIHIALATKIHTIPGSYINLLQANLFCVREGPVQESLPAHTPRHCLIYPVDYLPVVLERQRDAIIDFCSGDKRFTSLLQDIIFPRRIPAADTATELLNTDATDQPAVALGYDIGRLNTRQQAAVRSACAQSKPSIAFVEGPPGTGKTRVAAAIVKAWLADDGERPILVATGTHTAKDLLASLLQKDGIRLANRRDATSGKKSPPALEEYGPAPVFVETVYMAAVPGRRHLPRVLLDESTQFTTSAALVAIGQGCEQLVMIGDSKQLGPISCLGQGGLLRSADAYLLERESAFEHLQLRSQTEAVSLNVQYRMDPGICAYPSARFYSGQLVDADSTSSEPLWDQFPLEYRHSCVSSSRHPVLFLDTSRLDGESRHESQVVIDGRRSFQNATEAQVIARVVKSLVSAGLRSEQIAVLTAYRAQRHHIAEALHGFTEPMDGRWQKRASMAVVEQRELTQQKHPRVYTVDGFQGCEADVVIFSAVRSNADRNTGFLGDPRRVCVLLTRARRALIVVGDGGVITSSEEWKTWSESVTYHVRLDRRDLEEEPITL